MNKKYLMSPAQKRLFSLNQIQGANITYNIPMILRLNGKLDLEKLQSSINHMIKRHEVLRTHFAMIQGKFIQIVEDEAECTVTYKEGTQEGIMAAIDSFVQPFDLTKPPLMRAEIYNYAKDCKLLLFDFHHIIMDGGSMGIFLEELTKLYVDEKLEPVKLQYKDYSAWMMKQNLEGQEQYWLKQFSDGIPEAEFPTDYIRGKDQSFNGESVEMVLNNKIKEQVKNLCMRFQTTEYMVVLAAFMALISKYTGKTDVVVGTPVSGRNHPTAQNMLGMFVNTLVLKECVYETKSFMELLKSVRNTCLEAFDNQGYEFEVLVNKLKIKKAENRNPLFDIMFALSNNEPSKIQFGNIEAEEFEIKSNVAKFDLTFNFGECPDGYKMIWEYNTELFRHETIERMMNHFCILIKNALKEPEKAIQSISYLGEEESKKIAEVLNHTMPECSFPQTVVQLFEEMVKKYPEKIAITYKDKSLTYSELNSRANGIAEELMEYGIQTNEFVGVMAEKKIEVVVGLVSILKAGAAYLPLDPQNPISRTEYILNDSKCRVVLGFSKKNEDINNIVKVLDLEELFEKELKNGNRTVHGCAEDLAYLIYTSGTTGEPKGAMIEHRSIIRLVKNTNYIDFNDIRILQTGSLTFDASTFEIWGALLNGGFLLLVDTDVLTNCSAISTNIVQHQINTMWLTSSLFNQMISMDDTMFDDLKTLLIGGEKLSEKHVKILLDHNHEIELINGYGPTECTTFALTHRIERPVPEIIPIGKPIANTKAYIIKNETICGIGIPGELCLGGSGIAWGYLNKESLTKEKFIDNPIESGSRIYRTGDLVKLRENGVVEYLGRIDGQVKLRGFRIELMEIEKRIMSIGYIKAATVTIKEKEGDKILCAYLLSNQKVVVSKIKERLREILPEYMIPSFITQLDILPVNVNGKIDSKALPEPVAVSEGKYIEPQNKKQKELCQAFQEILDCGKVGIDDNFFELGGDSIKAIRLVSKIREFGYEVDVKTIMSKKTVRILESEIQVAQYTSIQEEVSGECKLSPIQKYFFDQKLKQPNYFNQSFMLETDLHLDIECLKKTLKALLQHHDQLRVIFHEKQTIRKIDESGDFEIKYYDLTQEKEPYLEMEVIGTREQSTLSIKENRLVKAVVYNTQEKNYLLLIAHHLLVDSVSWQILLEDINTIYTAYIHGIEPELPQKTDSYKKWVDNLYNYGQSSMIKSEILYWKDIENNVEKGRIFGEKIVGIQKEKKWLSCKLDRDLVQKIMFELNGVTDINTLLLLSLSKAVMKLCNRDTISFCMEGHGRYPISNECIIDRTVGWFTNIYPICIRELGSSTVDAIQKTKEILDSVPNHGLGYGIINAYGQELEGSLPEITYNYLGEITLGGARKSGFWISDAPVGVEIADNNMFGTPVSVNSMIIMGELHINIGYDSAIVPESFSFDISNNFVKEITTITNLCIKDQSLLEQRGKTLSGIAKSLWEYGRIKALERTIEVESEIYRVLYVESLTEEVYQSINSILTEADDFGNIDFILDMEQVYLANDVMSREKLVEMCEKEDFNNEKIQKKNYTYLQAQEKHVYQPSAIEEMFLRNLEESWVSLDFRVRCGSKQQIRHLLKNLMKEQSVFRTSVVNLEGRIMLCEHEYHDLIEIPVYDLRYVSYEDERKIRRQVKQREKQLGSECGCYTFLYCMSVLRLSEIQYELVLKISHCIWDKMSEEIFVGTVQEYAKRKNTVDSGIEKNDFKACDFMMQRVKNVDYGKICAVMQWGKKAQVFSKYQKKVEGIRIERYETAVVNLNDAMRKIYQENQWNFSIYFAKTIICANTGCTRGEIPIYVVQEDRRYMMKTCTDSIGSYIDLLPVCISVDAQLGDICAQESIECIQKMKREYQLNLMEFMRFYRLDINFQNVYSINLQNLYGLTQKQYQDMSKAMKNKKAGCGFEIVVNEYKDCLVFAYPVTNCCNIDIKSMLLENCKMMEGYIQ